MNGCNSLRGVVAVLTLSLGWPAGRGLAEGIPEPSLVVYGVVRHALTAVPVTFGSVQWTWQPVSGPGVVISGQMTNVNDQFSYVFLVPLETPLAGRPATSNVLALPSTPVAYHRGEVRINGQLATLVSPAQSTFSLTRDDRGKVERIDLRVSLPFTDTDGDGLPDEWELQYFAGLQLGANADPDGDGLSNLEELKAGTSPNDPQSQFAFIKIESHPQGGAIVEWSSANGRSYTLLRSPTILGGFAPIRMGLTATPPVNSYRDPVLPGSGPFFYLLRVEE